MAITPTILSPQGRALTVTRAVTPGVNVPTARAITVYNYPTPNMKLSAFEAEVVFRRTTAGMNISQYRSLVVCSGRVANPRVRAWTFTMDGHDFYVLRLGDKETIIYDVASEQWVQWGSDEGGAWRLTTGINWVGGQKLGNRFGSAVVAGDDTFGLLWFFNPLQPYDDVPDPARTPQQLAFTRIVSGQVLSSGREYLPCYAIFVDGDNYGTITSDFVPTITLESSDDQGITFYAHDTFGIPDDISLDNPYLWTSLGQISSPGRIFRITDNGVYSRIDGMEMNDG